MTDAAMQTHMYLAHVYDEVSCMFCDLRGVTVEEMTLHINSVHCSDNGHDDGAGHNGMQWHDVNSVQQDADHQRANQAQSSQLSNVESGQTELPDASSVTFALNDVAGSQHVLRHECLGNSRNINRDKQQKRKLSGTVIASSSLSAPVEKTALHANCISSYNDAELTSRCCTSSSHYLESTSSRLPKMENGVDKTFQGNRFVECSFLY